MHREMVAFLSGIKRKLLYVFIFILFQDAFPTLSTWLYPNNYVKLLSFLLIPCNTKQRILTLSNILFIKQTFIAHCAKMIMAYSNIFALLLTTYQHDINCILFFEKHSILFSITHWLLLARIIISFDVGLPLADDMWL
jgi:hypothetical protein